MVDARPGWITFGSPRRWKVEVGAQPVPAPAQRDGRGARVMGRFETNGRVFGRIIVDFGIGFGFKDSRVLCYLFRRTHISVVSELRTGTRLEPDQGLLYLGSQMGRDSRVVMNPSGFWGQCNPNWRRGGSRTKWNISTCKVLKGHAASFRGAWYLLGGRGGINREGQPAWEGCSGCLGSTQVVGRGSLGT